MQGLRAIFAGSLLLICFCGGCARDTHQAGVLRVATQSDATTLDPARAYDTESIPYVRVLYRGLVDYGAGADIVNEVARDRDVSPDGKTYWFKLRHDVYFRTGRRVTAEDFRYAMERVLDPATASDGLDIYRMIQGAAEFSADRALPKEQRKLQHPAGITVRGDDEISYTLVHPDATFINWLALPFAYAVPKDWTENLEAHGETLSEHPDGDGPFFLQQWVHDASLVLVRNPRYFRPGFPHCNKVVIEMGNQPYLQMMRFERGDLDLLKLDDAFPPDFVRLTHDPKWKPYIAHAPMMDIRYVALNTEMPPFNNVLVRRAVNYAINRKRIASFLAGRATVAHGVLPPGMPGYNPNLKGYNYDPAKARALLRQAGYGSSAPPITFYYSDAENWDDKAAQSIKADLQAVGITLILKQVRYSELKELAGKRHNISMSLIGWLQDFPDPSDFLDILLNGKNITETASNNRAFYSNPVVNRLLDQAEVELNHDKRLQMYQQAEAIIVQDAPWVFLHHTEEYALHQPWVHGYTLHPMWSNRYEFISVGK